MLRDAGLLTAKDWGVVVGEVRRRLLKAGLPLVEAVRLLQQWVSAPC